MNRLKSIPNIKDVISKLEIARTSVIPEQRDKLIYYGILKLSIEINRLTELENKINNIL
jgi:hypothetical protein